MLYSYICIWYIIIHIYIWSMEYILYSKHVNIEAWSLRNSEKIIGYLTECRIQPESQLFLFSSMNADLLWHILTWSMFFRGGALVQICSRIYTWAALILCVAKSLRLEWKYLNMYYIYMYMYSWIHTHKRKFQVRKKNDFLCSFEFVSVRVTYFHSSEVWSYFTFTLAKNSIRFLF